MSRSAKKGPFVAEKLFKKVAMLNERRAKQRVGHGMQQNVSVAVPHQPVFELDRHPPENQGPIRGQPVNVVPQTDAEMSSIHAADHNCGSNS